MHEEVGDNIYFLVIMSTAGTALLVISFVILFIRNQNKLLANKQKLHDAALLHQKELLRTIIKSQEEERKRIGQDLHDEVGGSLSNLRMLMNRFDGKNKDVSEEQKEAVNVYRQLIDKIVQDVRNISHNLSPPGLALFGFSEALEELKDVVSKGDDSFISITNHAEAASEKLAYPVALALVRVLQELITNTLKHSGAKRIGISLFMENEDLLAIHYTDDGIGYDGKLSKKGMGMHNIESRLDLINSTYTIQTAINKGFGMFIYVHPLAQF